MKDQASKIVHEDFSDRLGRRILQSGDRLRVRWPDGSRSLIAVEVSSTERHVMSWDRPVPRSIWAKQAFAFIHFRGVQTQVPLVGLEAEFVSLAVV